MEIVAEFAYLADCDSTLTDDTHRWRGVAVTPE